MLSDLDREAMTAYGVRLDTFLDYHGIANRAVIVVDRSGTVVFADEKTPEHAIPDIAGALAKVQEIAGH